MDRLACLVLVCLGLVCLGGACLASGCSGDDTAPAPPRKVAHGTEPSVWGKGPRRLLLVTMDTTRADRIGAYGHESAETPTIDELARRGVLFERVFAPSPVTLPSHTSILTGVFPSAHGVRDNAVFALSDEAESVAEVLRRFGWRTAAFVSSFVLDPRFGLGQGFETYRGTGLSAPQQSAALPERDARAVVNDAIGWLRALEATDSFFLWVHFYDPHYPYEPPSPWREKLADAYDGEIAYCDAQLGRLLKHMRELGLTDDLVSIVTADHGECLGEHGEATHGVFLYDAAMRVPLVISGTPLRARGGTRISGPTSVVQIAPTILSLAGIGRQEMRRIQVDTLVAENGEATAPTVDVTIHVETLLPFRKHRWHPSRGLVWREHKLIVGRSTELYSLRADPSELTDLASTQPDLLAQMRDRLDDALAQHAPLDWAGQARIEGRDLQQLRALGYTGAALPEIPEGAELPDARDRIGDLAVFSKVHAFLVQARRLQTTGGAGARQATQLLAHSKQLLAPVRQANPRDPLAITHLGTIECALGNFAAAIPLLEEATRNNPMDATVRHNLAACYHRTGRVADALQEMLVTASIDPGHAQACQWLAGYHTQAQQFGRAYWWAERLVDLLDDDSPQKARVRGMLERVGQQMRARGQTKTAPEGFPLQDIQPR